MTIDEAIEIKERKGDEFLQTDPDKIDEADRLSIEALKRVKYYKKLWDTWHIGPLPGETKE